MPPEPPAQKVSATVMQSQPSNTPAFAPPSTNDGPSTVFGMSSSNEPAPIDYRDAHNLANKNEHIIIVESKANPDRYYMFNNKTGVSTWIFGDPPSGLHESTKSPGHYYSVNKKRGTSEWLDANQISSDDADNALKNYDKFEIRTHDTPNTPNKKIKYLRNKEIGTVGRIIE
jgi:hypothetical protein